MMSKIIGSKPIRFSTMKQFANIIFSLVALISFTVPAQAKALLKVIPNSIVQGQAVLLEIQLEENDPIYDVLTVTLSGPKKQLNLPMIHIEKRKYRAYMAIPADFTAGVHPLRIDYTRLVSAVSPSPEPLSSPVVSKNQGITISEQPIPESTFLRPIPTPIPTATPKPIPQSGQLLEQPFTVIKGRFRTQYIRYRKPPLAPHVQAIIDKEEELVTKAKHTVSSKQLWQGSFIKPVSHRISSLYGNRRFLNGKYNGYHGGVDFASPMGTPIRATNSGKVILARYFSKWNSNGNIVFLDHGHGVTSVYIHLSRISVEEGQMVTKGQTIGRVGSTGRSTGPHLHWGLYLNGQNTDGLGWIRFSQTFFN